MAQSDFVFYNSTTLPVGGGQGSAALNSGLSNPLASSSFGTFCRSYKIQASGQPSGVIYAWNGFVSSSNFVGIPNTKAISLRAVVRTENGVQPLNNRINVGLRARTDPSNYISGYYLTLGSLNINKFRYNSGQISFDNPYTTTYGLYLCFKKPNGDKDETYPDVLISGSFAHDTWYPIRMDILPFGDLQDTINIYTGSMDISGNITWSNILYTTNVTNGQTIYNSASSGLYCGYSMMAGNVEGAADTSNPGKAYIDGLDIRVSNV